jgi:hypothetical protein
MKMIDCLLGERSVLMLGRDGAGEVTVGGAHLGFQALPSGRKL